MIAACGNAAKNKKNASRGLHNLILRQRRSLPVDASFVETPVRLLKGKPRVEVTSYPILLPSTWLKFMCSIGGEVVLGGHNIDNPRAWQSMLGQFWTRFHRSQPGINMHGVDPELAIPICVHGDEGRGKVKRPIMIIAWQPVVSWLGPAVVNTPGNLS